MTALAISLDPLASLRRQCRGDAGVITDLWAKSAPSALGDDAALRHRQPSPIVERHDQKF